MLTQRTMVILVGLVYTKVYTNWKVMDMETAKLFANGKSQAVRLPKNFRFTGDEVYIKKIGDAVMLYPKDLVWDTFVAGVDGFSDDFMADGRDQGIMQEREKL